MKLAAIFDIKRLIGSAMLFIVSALVLQGTVDRMWPASYWIDMRSITVSDAPYGTAPRVDEDRTIKRPFIGSYRVEIEQRRDRPPAGYVLICSAADMGINYAPDNVLPEDMNLSWWVSHACRSSAAGNNVIVDVHLLPLGTYRVETCRTIQPLRFFSPRGVCRTSNDFNITR